ncbi:type I secretion system permease/ATPase [Sulfurospirillum arcachonense]|uniref:type I secretion system permease/ATPase n=1 Tax=Sulfurospirillum arcachonense TaxID=57666 RepID=UPI000469175D|nr:type I secretion system permease/ATPase [Sulfurospirillum arcachonense]
MPFTKLKEIKDPLLECLVIFTKLHNKPYSAEALTEGLPVSGGSNSIELFSTEGSKALFSRAAKRAGFTSTLIKKSLKDISPLVLPCILILKGRKACILEEFDVVSNTVKIIYPDMPSSENWVDMEMLEEQYLGYVFYLKKEFVSEDRTKTHLIDKDNVHWFWGTLKRSRDIYRDVIIASLVINIFVLASPLFTMNVYDRVVPNNATDTLWVLAIGVIVIYIIDLFLKLTRAYFLEIAGKKSDIIMSSILFEKVLDLQMASRPKSIGSFANNLKEFDSIRSFFTSTTIAALVDLPFTIIFLSVIYFIAGSIVFVPILISCIIITYMFFVKEPLQKSIESTYEASAIKNGILIETLGGIETVKTMSGSGLAQWNWEEATGEIANRSVKSKILTSSINTVTAFLVQLNTVIVIVIGVYMIKQMDLTMGGLIAAVILSSRAIAPMGQVVGLAASYEQTKTAYKTVDNIMQMPVERPEGKKFVRRDSMKGEIEFKDVDFSYPDAQNGALNKVSFKITAGEKVGIIGKNGSGKTTIEKLMLGLYAPDEGAILVDGIDINQIDPVDLRKNIGYVPQDVVLFNGTVKENIVYKYPAIDDASILKAAKISGTDEFINSHPLGFDMPVYERGEGISGGQRQSIAIARAFLLDSPIVILDEPTNSLDNTTEMKIRGLLKENIQEKTVILVTHKSSLLSLVDRLIVMDGGKVVMDGKKDKILMQLQRGAK